MSAKEELKAFSEVVVFIDDGFASKSLGVIDGDDWAALRDADRSSWDEIREKYSILAATPSALKRDEDELKKAWALYQNVPEELSVLDHIFKKVLASQKSATLPLMELINIFKEELGLTVCCHPDIESAKFDIKRSKLVFLDFYLYDQRTTDKAIQGVSTFSSLFSQKVDAGGNQYNRLLFLVSTSLPSAPDVEKFRKAAKIKAAFFKPVPKDKLNKEWVQNVLVKRVGRYEDLHHMAAFLETFSEQMEGVMKKIQTDFESLELHDLAILDHMRLKADQADLGKYMSWLISEALAARIRNSAPVLKASESVNALHKPPFQGMLSTNQVLFSWFSDLTFGAPGQSYEKLQFGDVFFEKRERELNKSLTFGPTSLESNSIGKANIRGIVQPFFFQRYRRWREMRRRPPNVKFHQLVEISSETDLVLIIAPACDLQRANGNYEVLCVRGKISQKTPSLVDVVQHSMAFGRDSKKGHFKHLLRLSDGEHPTFLLVEWHPKKIITIGANKLQRYRRIARLNELFCQEIKEDALRSVGRVGVPVDPAFSVPLGATIVYTPKGSAPVHKEVPDADTISGVFTSGNFQNPPQIILAEEFIERFSDEATKLKEASVDNKNLANVCARFEEANDLFLTKGGEGFALKKDQASLCNGRMKICYVSKFIRESQETDFFGVYFYPRGAVKDKPTDKSLKLDDH